MSKPISGKNIKGKLMPTIPTEGSIKLETTADGSVQETGEGGATKGAEISVNIPASFADTLGELSVKNRYHD